MQYEYEWECTGTYKNQREPTQLQQSSYATSTMTQWVANTNIIPKINYVIGSYICDCQRELVGINTNHMFMCEWLETREYMSHIEWKFMLIILNIPKYSTQIDTYCFQRKCNGVYVWMNKFFSFLKV